MKLKDIIFGTALILGFAAVFVYINAREKKIVYIKIEELYNGFEMKKELERAYITVQTGRKQHLDSVELELKILSNRLGTEGAKKELIGIFEAKRETYLQKKEQFEEDNAQMQDQYTSKIRKQLNQYVTDYGKERHCDYILGAEGSGALMYAVDKDDVTADVLLYINNKYKGIK